MKSGAGLLNYVKRNLPVRQGEVVEPSSELAELMVRVAALAVSGHSSSDHGESTFILMDGAAS